MVSASTLRAPRKRCMGTQRAMVLFSLGEKISTDWPKFIETRKACLTFVTPKTGFSDATSAKGTQGVENTVILVLLVEMNHLPAPT